MASLTIVIPVFNEAAALPVLHQRLVTVLNGLGLTWDVVFVDDGSRDGSWEVLAAFHRADPRFGAIALSRNFGHQVAVTAGLDHATGDAVVVMDADLQDPPEVIAEFVARWREGFDVVYGVRNSRADESAFKRWSAAAFYRVIRALTPVDMPLDSGDFRLMSRRVVAALRDMPERNRFVRGLVAWAGFTQTGVAYDRAARVAGTTKYPLRSMVRLASDAIVSFSSLPLQVAMGLGFALSAACFLYAGWAMWMTAVHGRHVPGWASLMVAILLVGGVQLVCLGIIGEYIGRIYDEVKRRPLYLVGAQLRATPVAEVLRSDARPS